MDVPKLPAVTPLRSALTDKIGDFQTEEFAAAWARQPEGIRRGAADPFTPRPGVLPVQIQMDLTSCHVRIIDWMAYASRFEGYQLCFIKLNVILTFVHH